MIACKELTKIYKNGNIEQTVLDAVNLHVADGEFLCRKTNIIPTFCGKIRYLAPKNERSRFLNA